MAKITPIDVVKGISGKFGGHANEYFATNKYSGKIHLAKLSNPYKGAPTERQAEIQAQFKVKAQAANKWLRDNRPSETTGAKGTAEYQLCQELRKSFGLSNIRQVVYKYMDDDGKITVPTVSTEP